MRTKTKTVYQMEMTECGAASLGMILLYHGCYVPLEKLRIDTGVSRDGCNAYNILLGAEQYGLKGRGAKISAKKLRGKSFPCIIHWNFNHFVVLEGFDDKYAYLNDPAQGRYRVSFESFEMSFTGIALFFQKTDNFKKNKQQGTVLRALAGRVNRQRNGYLALLLLGLLLIAPGLLIPMLSQIFVDQILGSGTRSLSDVLLTVMIFNLMFQICLTWYRDFLQERIGRKISILSTRDLVEHILKLPIPFFEQRYIGDVISRNANNDQVNEFLLNDLVGTLLDLFTAIFYLVVLIQRSLILTMIGLVGIFADIIISRIRIKRITALAEKNSIDSGRLNGVVYSGLSITETLKASGVENEYVARIIGQEAKVADTEQENSRLQGIMDAVSGVSGSVFNLAMLLTGAVFVMSGRLTAGMLVSFLSLFAMLDNPIKKLVGFVQQAQVMRACLNRVEDVERYQEAYNFRKRPEKMSMMRGKLIGEIEVRNLKFGYNRLYPPNIKEFSFYLSCGKTIALVGSSGSGKSTVGRLLSGLYLPWEGEILFDNVPKEDIPQNILNASIATVSQNVVLFSGTVRDNITMWNPNILEEDMIHAAKDACIHDVIMGKTGAYDYSLNENGGNFSGGQRQRLEIARALALNPSILIMDEATSALDTNTEKKIIDNIKRRGCTCVIVAHRLSAIRDCDEILVIKNGEVIQRGTHEQLLTQGGYYSELVRNY